MDTFRKFRQKFETFHPIQEIKRMERKKLPVDPDNDATDILTVVNYLFCKSRNDFNDFFVSTHDTATVNTCIILEVSSHKTRPCLGLTLLWYHEELR
jgi:hypothetical protein